jgi:hypothetical protein
MAMFLERGGLALSSLFSVSIGFKSMGVCKILRVFETKKCVATHRPFTSTIPQLLGLRGLGRLSLCRYGYLVLRSPLWERRLPGNNEETQGSTSAAA